MKGNFSLPKIVIFSLLAVSLGGIFGTVVLVQQQQDTRSRATYINYPTPTKAKSPTPTTRYTTPTIPPCQTTQGGYYPVNTPTSKSSYPNPTAYPNPTGYPCPTASPTLTPTTPPTTPPDYPTPTICPTLNPVKNVRIECPNCK